MHEFWGRGVGVGIQESLDALGITPSPPPPMTFERHRNHVTVVRMCKLEESTHHGLLTAHLFLQLGTK